MNRTQMVEQVAGHLHADQLFDAAKVVLEWSDQKAKLKTRENAVEPLLALVHGLLDSDDYIEAAKILWTPTIFTGEPRCTRLVWQGIRNHTLLFLQGSSSVSKTYGAGVNFFLDWLRDPEFTTVKVLGPSEQHLQDNLFSHLVTLHRSSSLPLPGIIGDLFIGLDLRNRRGAISGTVVPLGRKGAGRLQGVKRFPRPKPHEVFGPLSRMRVLIDEIEKVPVGIWSDLDNVVSNVDGLTGLKIVCAFNPEMVGGPVYQRAEPPRGWASFDPETDEEWDSPRGWHVVRLDAERTENVVQNKVVYPGLQTREGLDKLAKSTGGTNSPGYQIFGRGTYPVQGTPFSVIPGDLLVDFRAKVYWYEKPRLFASVDSALEGDDPAVMATGNFGLATGVEFLATKEFPSGRVLMFQDDKKKSRLTPILCVETLFDLARGDTVKMAGQIKQIGLSLGLDPGHLLLDRTGNGAGVHDLLRAIWAAEIMGVNYSESPTHRKILAEDTQYCDELFERVYSELWFAMRRWRETGAMMLAPAVPTDKLFDQLTTRNYVSGKRNKVEPKRDYKARSQGKSPNEADAVSLLLHVVRLTTHHRPGLMLGDPIPGDSEGFGNRVGLTDRMVYLD